VTRKCELRAANGMPDLDCDHEDCVYWRLVGHLGVAEGGEGCAIQHFELLDGGEEIAEWLLSVKERVESQAFEDLPQAPEATG
jgi:hypothetical protein